MSFVICVLRKTPTKWLNMTIPRENIMESDGNLPGIKNPVADPAIGQGGKKYEIYTATFGGHLFMTYFHKAWGPSCPRGPPPGSATEPKWNIRKHKFSTTFASHVIYGGIS